jgi:hypothetical protein
MPSYEYKVVPAPRKGIKARGAKTPEDRFALALTNLRNEAGAEGWEYLRADTLPAEERTGWTSKTTVTQHVLVFRRELAPAAPERRPAPAEAPVRQAYTAEAPEATAIPVRREAAEGAAPRLGPARDDVVPRN